MHMEKMTVGVESGCNGNGLWMEKMVTTHSYGWKRSFGDFHYRSVHYDFSEHSPGAVGGCDSLKNLAFCFDFFFDQGNVRRFIFVIQVAN